MPESSVKKGGKRLFGLRPGALRLAAVALLLSLALCGAEKVSGGKRDVYGSELFNQLELSASAAVGLLSGEIPPRVSPTLTGGLGNPYHQFYSPLPYAAVGAVAVILKDVISAYSVTVILMLAFAFIYAFRLGMYLTGSGPCAAFAACLYATAPYIHASRTLSGAYDEYFALCLLPAVLYHGLRALARRSCRQWLIASFFCAALVFSNLWTSFAFLIFCALYIILALASSAAGNMVKVPRRGGLPGSGTGRSRETSPAPVAVAVAGAGDDALTPPETAPACESDASPRPRPRKSRWKPFLRRSGVAASVAGAAALLAMYFLGPVLLYDADMTRNAFIGLDRPGGGFVTPFLSLFSMRDTPWDWSTQFIDFSRYQAGLLILASVAAYGWYRCLLKGRRIPSLPLFIVPVLMILLMARPSLIDFRLLDAFAVPRHAYRLLGLLTLAGTVCGALALKDFFMSKAGFTPAAKAVTALALSGLALVLASPYIYPDGGRYSNVTSMSSNDLLRLSSMDYGEAAFLRRPPPDVGWTEEDVKVLMRRGTAGDAYFSVDLGEYGAVAGAPPGEVLLDVLHFPGLQDVTVRVDGFPVTVGLDTYWQHRSSVPALPDESAPLPPGPGGTGPPGAFHGLKITGAPSRGILEVEVEFTGMGWANLVSLSALLLMALFLLLSLRKRGGRDLGTGSAGVQAGSAGGCGGGSPVPEDGSPAPGEPEAVSPSALRRDDPDRDPAR
ncbi:MAG: hypothetical protein LBQ79_03035 [Deltaproteobacteria bacterium]|jgi:hypothetical protein|nr:hypothetical protein [Deltaproteobacteria bacterium]